MLIFLFYGYICLSPSRSIVGLLVLVVLAQAGSSVTVSGPPLPQNQNIGQLSNLQDQKMWVENIEMELLPLWHELEHTPICYEFNPARFNPNWLPWIAVLDKKRQISTGCPNKNAFPWKKQGLNVWPIKSRLAWNCPQKLSLHFVGCTSSSESNVPSHVGVAD